MKVGFFPFFLKTLDFGEFEEKYKKEIKKKMNEKKKLKKN